MALIETIRQFDTRLFLQLNGMNSPWWDTCMMLITRKETWLPLYLLLLFLIFRTYKSKAMIILLLFFAGFVFSDQVAGVIKELVQRVRPSHDPALQNLTHVVLRKGGLFSFVSSHASNTFFVLTFTGLLFRNRISLATILLWALLVSYSRIYVGAHYPLDLISGWILGIISGFLFFRLLVAVELRLFIGWNPRIEKTLLPESRAGLVFLTFISVLTTVFVATYLLHKYNFL